MYFIDLQNASGQTPVIDIANSGNNGNYRNII